MSENSFEHTTSIVGLTCEPLNILSETISPQEMSRVRGGTDGMGGGGPGSMSSGQNPDEAKAERQARRTEAQKLLEEQESKDTAGLFAGTTYYPLIDVSGSLNTNAQADSSGTQDQNGSSLVTWDFDFSDDGTEDDGTEDECTVPYDCGDEENDEGNNDEGSGLPDEENSSEGNNG